MIVFEIAIDILIDNSCYTNEVFLVEARILDIETTLDCKSWCLDIILELSIPSDYIICLVFKMSL